MLSSEVPQYANQASAYPPGATVFPAVGQMPGGMQSMAQGYSPQQAMGTAMQNMPQAPAGMSSYPPAGQMPSYPAAGQMPSYQ